jgi:hypothetical protein
MNWADVATVALGLVAVLGGVGAIAAWFYKRGGAETKLIDSVDANTAATEKLTGHMMRLDTKLGEHDITLADHAARLRAGGL